MFYLKAKLLRQMVLAGHGDHVARYDQGVRFISFWGSYCIADLLYIIHIPYSETMSYVYKLQMPEKVCGS